MTQYVIRSEGYAQGIPGGAEGEFLEWYDGRKDGPAGEEMGGWTPDIDKAMKFDSASMAWAKWREPMVDAHNVPRQRPDGSGAERPLTAFSISVLTVEMAGSKLLPPTDPFRTKALQILGLAPGPTEEEQEQEDDDREDHDAEANALAQADASRWE